MRVEGGAAVATAHAQKGHLGEGGAAVLVQLMRMRS